MCDYNSLSKKTVQTLPVPLTNLRHHLGPPAHNKLLKVVAGGRARSGHDLHDGKALPPGTLARGHYLNDSNFQRALSRMNAEPHRCQWCGGPLPASFVRQHQQPHDHREHIEHHFHPACWKARLIAVAAIFGHVRPDQLLRRSGPFKRRFTFRETVTVTIKKVFKVHRRCRTKPQPKWRR